jgi:hypothetical protein
MAGRHGYPHAPSCVRCDHNRLLAKIKEPNGGKMTSDNEGMPEMKGHETQLENDMKQRDKFLLRHMITKLAQAAT